MMEKNKEERDWKMWGLWSLNGVIREAPIEYVNKWSQKDTGERCRKSLQRS